MDGNGMEEIFPDQRPAEPCSWNECKTGHRWPPSVVTVPCKGCQVAAIAIKKENCPICNEPIVQTSLRIDFVPRGSGIAARCKGEAINGDSVDITLEQQGWKEIEGTWRTFDEKKAEEDEKVPKREDSPNCVG